MGQFSTGEIHLSRRRCREDYMKLLKYFNHSGMTPDMKMLEWKVSKGNHPQMALIQVSEIL